MKISRHDRHRGAKNPLFCQIHASQMLLTFVLLLFAQSGTDQACDTARIRRVIDELQSRQANVGVQVAVRAGGRLVYSRGFGFADLEDSARVTPRTLFGVASVTKAVTGLALLKLWERGAFDLDAPIQRYVPTFPVKPGIPITPRLLAAHLAGLRHWGSERGPVLYARHFDDVKDVLPLFQDDTLIAAVGSGYRYSSPGYNVLGAAIEAAAGTPYQQWVVESVIRPLGLAATAFDDVRVVLPRRARRYSFYDLQTFADIDQPERVPDWDYSHNMAGGNLNSTAEDMVRLGAAVLAPGFLSDSAYRLLTTPVNSPGGPSPMAFGWFISGLTSTPRRLASNGSNAGVQAGIAVFPDHGVVVAAVTNTWGKGSRSGEFVSAAPDGLLGRIGAACGVR